MQTLLMFALGDSMPILGTHYPLPIMPPKRRHVVSGNVMWHFMTDNKTTQYREDGVLEIKL
jgi:hypothetical protein